MLKRYLTQQLKAPVLTPTLIKVAPAGFKANLASRLTVAAVMGL